MKKRVLFFLFVLAALLLLSAFAVCAETGACLGDLCVVVQGQAVLPVQAENETRFFLPSFADLHAVMLQFVAPEGATVTVGEGALLQSGEAVDLAALASFDAQSGVYTLPFTQTPTAGEPTNGTLCFYKSENVGAMFLSVADAAYGRAWIESSREHINDAGKMTDVSMRLQTADAAVVYDGKLTSLKGRGNSTWTTSAKKPYQIKLDKKTDLLSTGDKANKNKTWVLLANALDKTLFKTALAFDLAQFFGLRETPEYTFIDLYFDGEYRGLYQITEKAQINPGRVEIADLESHNSVADETATQLGVNSLGLAYQYNPTAVCDTQDISGGYLLEQDSAFYRTENSWFQLFDGSVLVVKSPEFCTKEQIEYISVRFNEAAMASRDNLYNGRSVLELLDVKSVAEMFILTEYMKNCDFTVSSTYYFLPEAGNDTYAHKFYAGPVWDFDTSLGNRTDQAWMRDATTLFRDDTAMFQGSFIRAAIKAQAQKLETIEDVLFAELPTRRGGVSSFSWYKDNLRAARQMNDAVWPYEKYTANTFALSSYDENYNYALSFLRTRHTAILPQIAAWETPAFSALENCCNGLHTYTSYDRTPTCTEAGREGRVCSVCGNVSIPVAELPARGHFDENNDGVCDRCGTRLREPTFLEKLQSFFEKLLRFLKQLLHLG